MTRYWKFTSLLSSIGFSLLATAFLSVNHSVAVLDKSPFLRISCDIVDASSTPGRLAGNGFLIIAVATVLTYTGLIASFFRSSPKATLPETTVKPNRWN